MIRAGEREAGRPSSVTSGRLMWPTMTKGIFRSAASRKGTSSQASSSSRVRYETAKPLWESSAVAPWPGKCL